MMAMAALGAPAAMAGEQGAPPAPDNTPSIYRVFNDGEDFTRSVQRLDLRERYENLPSVKKFDPEKWQTTFRTDNWTELRAGWAGYEVI